MTGDALPHRIYPCDECPVRTDNRDNPKSQFPAERWRALHASIDDGYGGSAGFGAPIFGCHKGAPGTDEDLACAGWLASFGGRNMAIRIALIGGRLNPAALEPGPNWPRLYETWEDMVAWQTATEDQS